jgi:Flp pilus assembly protein TadB
VVVLTRTANADPALSMDRLRLRVAAGAPPDDLSELSPRSRRAVAVALTVGAPLLDAIEGAQAAEDDAAQARRAVAVASAQTKAVAAGLLLAPAVLVPALSRLVGADLVGFYTSGLGLLVLGVGVTLLLVGGLLVVTLVRRVGRSAAPASAGGRGALAVGFVAGVLAWRVIGPVAAPPVAMVAHHLVEQRSAVAPVLGLDEAADLAATALAGGVSAPEALRVAADQLPDLAHRLGRMAFGLELGMGADDLYPRPTRGSARSGAAPPGSGRPAGASGGPRTRGGAPADGLLRLVAVLTTADEVGAPTAPSLRRLARDLRADELARVLAAAERLPAQLTFPTALCLLPATVLLVGAPIVHAGLEAAGI